MASRRISQLFDAGSPQTPTPVALTFYIAAEKPDSTEEPVRLSLDQLRQLFDLPINLMDGTLIATSILPEVNLNPAQFGYANGMYSILSSMGVPVETSNTFAAIDASTTKRLVEVLADETNGGIWTLYFHSGANLRRFTTTTVSLPTPTTTTTTQAGATTTTTAAATTTTTTSAPGAYVIEKTFLLNFSSQYVAESTGNYNNLQHLVNGDVTIAGNFVKGSLIDNTAAASTLSVTNQTAFLGADGGGITSGQTAGVDNNSGVVPDQVLRGKWVYDPSSQIKITGLTVGKYYNFYMLANGSGGDNALVNFTIGTTTTPNRQQNVPTNLGNIGTVAGPMFDDTALDAITGVQPNGAGEVIITCTRVAGGFGTGAINFIGIEETNIARPLV